MRRALCLRLALRLGFHKCQCSSRYRFDVRLYRDLDVEGVAEILDLRREFWDHTCPFAADAEADGTIATLTPPLRWR